MEPITLPSFRFLCLFVCLSRTLLNFAHANLPNFSRDTCGPCRRRAPSPPASRVGRAARFPTAARVSGATSSGRSRLMCSWRSTECSKLAPDGVGDIVACFSCAEAACCGCLRGRSISAFGVGLRPPQSLATLPSLRRSATLIATVAIVPPRAASMSGWRRWRPSRG